MTFVESNSSDVCFRHEMRAAVDSKHYMRVLNVPAWSFGTNTHADTHQMFQMNLFVQGCVSVGCRSVHVGCRRRVISTFDISSPPHTHTHSCPPPTLPHLV